MSNEYEEFISGKKPTVIDAGFEPSEFKAPLFPFQRDSVEWAIRRGRAALFLDTGLGKSICQLEWARQVSEHTDGRVLILAPLAVSQQTVREGLKFGVTVKRAESQADVEGPGIYITNYERLGKFDKDCFSGVVLDESGILKSFSGPTKNALVDSFKSTPYRLACTATPAPNDHLELGNHAEFLGVMSSHQMIARWFINDTSEFGKYTLKGHAVESFWDWVSSWAMMAGRPSDIGDYSDDGYVLPELVAHNHVVDVDLSENKGDGMLFRIPEMNATSVHKEKRISVKDRAGKVAELVAREPDEGWILWCDTDYEADELLAQVPGAVDVRGSSKHKERDLVAFSEGKIKILISKPKLAGFGLNWQHVARVAFVGATFSFESYYQAVRRCWRFGQKRPVDCHVVMASTEKLIWATLSKKRDGFEAMKAEMFKAARRRRRSEAMPGDYFPTQPMKLPEWIR